MRFGYYNGSGVAALVVEDKLSRNANSNNTIYGLLYWYFLPIIKTMFSNSDIANSLATLGRRLRELRLAQDDTQAAFAARIGVSTPTLRDMETGGASVSMGAWLAAFWMLGRLNDVDALLVSTSLFEDKPTRRRARRKP